MRGPKHFEFTKSCWFSTAQRWTFFDKLQILTSSAISKEVLVLGITSTPSNSTTQKTLRDILIARKQGINIEKPLRWGPGILG